jgi:hypothetical protein
MKLRLELLTNNYDSLLTQPFFSPSSTTLHHVLPRSVKHDMRKSSGNRSAAKGPRNQHKHTFENKRECEIVRKMRPMGPPPLLPTLKPWEIVRTKPQKRSLLPDLHGASNICCDHISTQPEKSCRGGGCLDVPLLG